MTKAQRSSHAAIDSVSELWQRLNLPNSALSSLHLTGSGPGLSSSFKVGHLAQASIALSALAASLFHAIRARGVGSDGAEALAVPQVTIPLSHACAEFESERLYTLNGESWNNKRSLIGGLHQTGDGYARIHDGFKHHRDAALRILGLREDASCEDIKGRLVQWTAADLEREGFDRGAVILKLRSLEEWDSTEQAKFVQDFPITVARIISGQNQLKKRLAGRRDKSLRGVRVVELTRVIAAPVAGRTLAMHGADVIWVASPNLEHQPDLDIDTSRGKRPLQLDLDSSHDRETLWKLLEHADVFLQSYRPGSLARRGFSPEQVSRRSKEGIVIADLTAWGFEGPWKDNRGFDSLVQTCSGINVAESQSFGDGQVSRVLPCQALDHASGYFLAAGITAALYKQALEGGSYLVQVSLVGTMKFLRSLGQYEGRDAFDCSDPSSQAIVPAEYFETFQTDAGTLKAVRHAAHLDGIEVGTDRIHSAVSSPEWQE
jgi:hypothetical protein